MSLKSPKRESAERAAETIPGLSAAAAAVGLQDHQRMLQQHAKRVADGYELGKAAFTAGQPMQPDSEEMSDILITGDIKVGSDQDAASVINAIKGQTEVAAPMPSRPKPPPIAAISASIITAGATIAGAIWYSSQPTIPDQASNAVDVGFGEPQNVMKK